MAGEVPSRAAHRGRQQSRPRRKIIVGTYNVFEAARQAGVARLEYASSNHVVGMYELDGAPALYESDDERRYDHTAELRPDSLYGVSKAYGEALGRFYMERYGLRVFCVGIGAVRAHDDPSTSTGNALIDLDAEGQRNRLRAVWLSRRDCAELIASCFEATTCHGRWCTACPEIHTGSGI
jgi:NAD+ dependent glucose-6-phosphate dehydrogenase